MSLTVDNKYVRLISGRLRNFKQKSQNLYNSSCCFCGDSKKNLTKARMYIFEKKGGLFVKCHNCGIGTNISGLLKHIDPSLFKEYTLERYTSGHDNNSQRANSVLQIIPPKFDKVQKDKSFEHAEWLSNLPSEHFAIQYVTKRQIPKKFYDKLLFTSHYKQFVDSVVPDHGKQLVDDARLVIPFYDEYDDLIAVSGRALETSDKTLRYVTIRTNSNQNKLIFGLDRIDFKRTVYLVEGPIDSLFIDNCLASADANLAMTAKEISSDKIVLIFDNEKRNKEIVKMMQNAINLNHNVVIWPDNIGEKDINEMIMSGKSQDEIQKIISSNTLNGLRAQLRFNSWKKV